MGGVNFLEKNKNNDNENNSANAGKNYGNLEWTKPDKTVADEVYSRNPNKDLNKNKQLVSEKAENASEIINDQDHNNKLSSADGSLSKEKSSSGFLSRFFNLGRWQKKEKLASDDLINRKKAIADLGDRVYEERNTRKNKKFENNGDQTARQSEDEQAIQLERKSSGSVAGFVTSRWQAPHILKTDLIKDELTIFIDWKKNFSYLFINLFLVLIISLIAYIGIRYWGQGTAEQVKALDKEILDLSEKINNFNQEKTEIDSWQKKLSLLNKALASHIYWTNFFTYLEKDTLASVYYSGGFKGDLTGKFSFDARANKFEDISNQVRVLKADNEFVNSVEVNQGTLTGDFDAKKSIATLAENSIGFRMNLTIKPDILYKK